MIYTDGYLIKYKYKIPLYTEGVFAHTLEWAEKYCKGKFGWHFDNDRNAIISFEQERDASLWTLRWMDEYNQRNT